MTNRSNRRQRFAEKLFVVSGTVWAVSLLVALITQAAVGSVWYDLALGGTAGLLIFGLLDT